jgi:hypothetical protein
MSTKNKYGKRWQRKKAKRSRLERWLSETIELLLVETIELIRIHDSAESLVIRSSDVVLSLLSSAADTIGLLLLLLRLIPGLSSRSQSNSLPVLALNTIRWLVDILLLGEGDKIVRLVKSVVVDLSLHNASAIVLALDTILLIGGLLLDVEVVVVLLVWLVVVVGKVEVVVSLPLLDIA